MTAVAIIFGLVAALVGLAMIGSARRARLGDEVADLKQAENIHAEAAASRADPIADPDDKLRSLGRLRD